MAAYHGIFQPVFDVDPVSFGSPCSSCAQCYFSYDFLVIVIVIVTHFLSF